MKSQNTVQQFLLEHLQVAQAKNAKYSMRSLARDLGLSAPTLSLVLKGKRRLGPESLENIAHKLGLSPKEKKQLLSLKPSSNQTTQLDLDHYYIVSDWRYFTFLNLVETSDFNSDKEWIAKRMGCSKSQVEKIHNRLIRLGLIEDTPEGLLRKSPDLRTAEEIGNLSMMKRHQQNLQDALDALKQLPSQKRDFRCLTFSYPKKNLPQLKKKLQAFLDELSSESNQQIENTDEVYELCLSLFPRTLESETF